MPSLPVQDGRKFFILPQGYEGGGYYTYGDPGAGVSQYAHPQLLSLIMQIAGRWTAIDTRKFGLGDISLANGPKHPDHATHRSGFEIDIRPLRKDGRRDKCWIGMSDYDKEGTAKLIALLNAEPCVRQILFNDRSIAGVRPAKGHSNHFHVALSLKG